jgi:NADH dehydrogenase FAD-containing subunit
LTAHPDAAPVAGARRRERIVIIGAGFGGLGAALHLGRIEADVTVVDRRNYHLFQPLLYQVATAVLSPADIAEPIRSIVGVQANTRVILAEVTGIDVAGRRVLVGGCRIPYDQLVIATGARGSYFGYEEWAAGTSELKNVEEATAMRRRILCAFELAEASADEAERRRLLTFVIIGGGSTGVELAGALANLPAPLSPASFAISIRLRHGSFWSRQGPACWPGFRRGSRPSPREACSSLGWSCGSAPEFRDAMPRVRFSATSASRAEP